MDKKQLVFFSISIHTKRRRGQHLWALINSISACHFSCWSSNQRLDFETSLPPNSFDFVLLFMAWCFLPIGLTIDWAWKWNCDKNAYYPLNNFKNHAPPPTMGFFFSVGRPILLQKCLILHLKIVEKSAKKGERATAHSCPDYVPRGIVPYYTTNSSPSQIMCI